MDVPGQYQYLPLLLWKAQMKRNSSKFCRFYKNKKKNEKNWQRMNNGSFIFYIDKLTVSFNLKKDEFFIYFY